MRLMFLIFACLCFYANSCIEKIKDTVEPIQPESVKQQLLALETKCLEHEFELDTASISLLLHNDFISISATDTSNKKMELEGIYKNISAMRSESIFIDSFKIEEPFIVKQFDNTAITIFICHTYKTAKGKQEEKRTKFYDVWRNVNGEWKAMTSQATVAEEIK